MTYVKRFYAAVGDASWHTLLTIPAGKKARLMTINVQNLGTLIARATFELVSNINTANQRVYDSGDVAISAGRRATKASMPETMFAGDVLRVRFAAAPTTTCPIAGTYQITDQADADFDDPAQGA